MKRFFTALLLLVAISSFAFDRQYVLFEVGTGTW